MRSKLKQFFGEPWDAPTLDGLEQGETPVGQTCYWCGENIRDDDRGFFRTVGRGSDPQFTIEAIHRECDARSVVGSVGHQLELCKCFGGPGWMDDPQELTTRQAAIAAWNLLQSQALDVFGS